MKISKKVTGIGGIFFKSKNPEETKDWYKKNLGFVIDEYGSMFESRNVEQPDQKEYLQWSPLDKDTDYFNPSDKEFMINYRVENMEEFVKALKKNGVNVLDDIESYDYGKFVHILDPENNKIELWELVDNAFTKPDQDETTK